MASSASLSSVPSFIVSPGEKLPATVWGVSVTSSVLTKYSGQPDWLPTLIWARVCLSALIRNWSEYRWFL